MLFHTDIEPPVLVTTTQAADITELPAGTPLFELSLPRLDNRMTVVQGTTQQALRKGPGRLEGTRWPGTGNTVIAGHRDTHFRILKDVRAGDEIWIDTTSRRYVYRIAETYIVPPEDLSPLNEAGEPILTLITCYPFYWLGPAPDRFIVKAVLVS